MIKQLKQRLDRVEARIGINSLNPISSPGMLTSQTTRGVMRRAKFKPGTGSSDSSNLKPRWG